MQESVRSRASLSEVKMGLDGAHLTATSAVAAALGPIQTHLERELEGVRRHVAALRMGSSAGKDGKSLEGMSKEEVERALSCEQVSGRALQAY